MFIRPYISHMSRAAMSIVRPDPIACAQVEKHAIERALQRSAQLALRGGHIDKFLLRLPTKCDSNPATSLIFQDVDEIASAIDHPTH
jgi:hypothetical protein